MCDPSGAVGGLWGDLACSMAVFACRSKSCLSNGSSARRLAVGPRNATRTATRQAISRGCQARHAYRAYAERNGGMRGISSVEAPAGGKTSVSGEWNRQTRELEGAGTIVRFGSPVNTIQIPSSGVGSRPDSPARHGGLGIAGRPAPAELTVGRGARDRWITIGTASGWAGLESWVPCHSFGWACPAMHAHAEPWAWHPN